jgi:hypothetical protein
MRIRIRIKEKQDPDPIKLVWIRNTACYVHHCFSTKSRYKAQFSFRLFFSEFLFLILNLGKNVRKCKFEANDKFL